MEHTLSDDESYDIQSTIDLERLYGKKLWRKPELIDLSYGAFSKFINKLKK